MKTFEIKKLSEAIEYMMEKHGADTRKGSTIPYFTHPIGVMNILLEEQSFDSKINEDVILAGLFHDLNEDANVTILTIEEKFGKEVARLVKNASEPEGLKKAKDQIGNWKKRKEHSLNLLRTADKFTKMVICADKLDNARAIHRDIISGLDVWKKFNAPFDDIKWYYESILQLLKSGNSIENTRMFKLLEIEVNEIFKIPIKNCG